MNYPTITHFRSLSTEARKRWLALRNWELTHTYNPAVNGRACMVKGGKVNPVTGECTDLTDRVFLALAVGADHHGALHLLVTTDGDGGRAVSHINDEDELVLQ